MPVDLARQMARLALCIWPGLAARHAILDVIGCLLTNRCQVEKLSGRPHKHHQHGFKGGSSARRLR